MKEIMEHIYYDWKLFKHKAELAILDDYAGLAKLFIEIFVCKYGVYKYFIYVYCL